MSQFNVVFLITCILVLAILVLYLFFWNRFIGYVLSLLVRLTSWNQASSSMWIDVGSIQFSLLAGRIMFKNFRYHSSNQTIRIVKGQISWRYWIRRPTEEYELSGARVGAEENELKKSRWPLSCRIHISIQGLEWFLYNRTAAYDNIIAQMEADPTRPSYSEEELNRSIGLRAGTSRVSAAADVYPPTAFPTSASVLAKAPSLVKRGAEWMKSQLPSLKLTDLLPVSIEADKGAILCGNVSTPNLLVAEFKDAEGTFGVVPSRSKFDFYKQMLSVKFRDASMHYAVNADYVEPMHSTGEDIQDRARHLRPSRHGSYMSYHGFQKLWRRVNLVAMLMLRPKKQKKFDTGPPAAHLGSFRGRKKINQSTEDETPVGADFSSLEYAIERTILEAPVLELSYYADVVGFVPTDTVHNPPFTGDPFDIGNGDMPPEWGIDLVVRNGLLRYGPWADRQRAELQRAFFPSAYRDVRRTARLKPGDQRVWPSMKIFIELRDSTTLQIPFREASKDWQWDGVIKYPRPRKREAASMHLRAGENSTISYIVPMIASLRGYEPLTEVHLDTVTVTSSLNDIRLLSAESCRVHCELPSPLKWNAERQWDIAVSLRKPVLYLTREHINMFTDLGKDWASGPPGDYSRFIPMIYTVDLDMQNYELNLYVNDHNIIDKPAIREENALLTIGGTNLKNSVQINSNHFRPISSLVPFSVEAPNILVKLTLPRWNTHSVNASSHHTDIGRIGQFKLDGHYRYFSEVTPDNMDQLKLDMTGHNVVFKSFGWAIRHFMILRENYFGSFTQFSTLYEYLDKKKRGLPISENIEAKYRASKSNMLEVLMQVEVDHGLMILPAGLPGYERSPDPHDEDSPESGLGACVVLSIPGLRVQLRTHEYFMEMSVNLDPISGSIEDQFMNKDLFTIPSYRQPRERILIDGLDIVANRLFGPQPQTATYMCIWEIHVGKIKSVLNTLQGRVLLAAGNAFRANFADALDAPAKEHNLPLDPDVTFLKVCIDAIDSTWEVGHAALQFNAPRGLRIESNDLAGQLYRKVTSIRLRASSVKMLVASRPNQPVWLEAGQAEFSVCLDLYDAPVGWREGAKAQAEFIATEDAPTGRARSLIAMHGLTDSYVAPPVHRFGLGDLYLTELQIPDAAHARQGLHIDDDQRTSQRYSVHQDWPSDSDNDEGVSEAMRDARLAKSRPVTPLLLVATPFEDGDMTSGDESDNEDLTDPEHSDSDWSESKETVSMTVLTTLISKYRKYTRSYLAHIKKAPSSWDGPAFQLIKDHRPPWSSTETDEDITHAGNPLSSFPLGDNPGGNTTTIRVRIEREIQLSFTPLMVPTVAQFLQDSSLNQLSPELYFDTMLEDCIDSIPGRDESLPASTIVDLSVSSVKLRFLHEISPGKMGTYTKHDGPSNAHVAPDGRVNLVSLNLTSVRVMGRTSNVSKNFSATVGSLAATIHSADRHYTHIPSAIFKRVYSFSVSRSHASLARKCISLRLDHIATVLDHSSPANLVASVSSIGSQVTKIQGIHKRWRRYSFARNQQLIRKLLTLASTKYIIDPLSSIQPSYLIHSGRPHQLRTDPTFKFLFQLRISLRYQDDAERQMVADFAPDLETTVTLEEILPLFTNVTLTLGVDTDVKRTIADMPLLLKFFPNPSAQPNPPTDNAVIAHTATITIGAIEVELWNFNRKSRNEFVVQAISVTLGQRNASLLQAMSLPPAGRTSLQKEKVRRSHRHFVVDASIGEIGLTIFPHLMDFAQQVLRVRLSPGTMSKPQSTVAAASPKIPTTSLESITLDIVFALQRFRFRAAAEKLIIEFGIDQFKLGSAIIISPLALPSASSQAWDTSMNHSAFFTEIFLRACAAEGVRENNQNVLASLTFSQGKISAVIRQEASANLVTKVVCGLGSLELSVPRSAIRLYRFIEEWRADYLPGIEATIKALLSELRRSPRPIPLTPKKVPKPPLIQFSLSLNSLRVSLQVMHGTWLSWEVKQSTFLFKSAGNTRAKNLHSFGIQLGSQIFSISSKPHWLKNTVKNKSVKFRLPMISVTGHYDGSEVHTMALIEFFSLTSRPSHWDTLLTVQQKFGQDFNDLIALINEKRVVVSPAPKKEASTASKLKFSGFLKMRGFQIGLEGLTSTILLQCEDIDGGFNNKMDRLWHIDVSDLAFSLAPRSSNDAGKISFERLNRLAFVVVDFQVSAEPGKTPTEKVLDVAVTKIHAVMQPSSIGQFGDFIDNLQAELVIRAEQRALDLAEFKEKTRNVMRTFETKDKPPSPEALQDWLSAYTIKFMVKNIGLAFPLALDQELKPGSQDSTAVGAFLFSIKSLVFGIQRGDSGQAAMKGTSFQFVSRFRQSVSADFVGENHSSRNRLVYPEMTAQVRSERSSTARRIRIGADVDGFILDIDSSIPDYVFSLIDVYRQGKDRVDRLTQSMPRNSSATDASPKIPVASLDTNYEAVHNSNILGSLTFQSGKVRLYSSSAPTAGRIRSVSLSAQEVPDEVSEEDIDVFNLPVVSVWAEYRSTPASLTLDDVQTISSTLTFKSTIHSSANAFRPTFLPFLTELIDHVEDRIRKATLRTPVLARSLSHSMSKSQSQTLAPPTVKNPPESVASMQISFSLRIDQSKLELTCHPDANVIAGVHWDSGGFVVNVSPGARQVAFTGSVAGLTIGLKHGFLSEDCVRLDARNLAFTVTFSQMEDENRHPMRSVSAILDTEFSGGVRFSRLQDILCFKAVWLDRIPVFSGKNNQPFSDIQELDDTLRFPSLSPSPPPSPLQQTEQGVTTIIMLRFRHVKLDIDFGQSITSVTVDFKNAVLRTKLTNEVSEFSLSVAESAMKAVGNMSGQGNVPDFLFQTKRRQENSHSTGAESNRMLDLTMTSGPLDLVLQSDHQMILQYHAEPLEVIIFDDWTKISDDVPVEDRRLRLSFTVFGKEVVAIATVGTIPKLVSYANKFKANLEAQREGASRESKAFRIASSPKPDNPLSDVANAMFHSARTRLREADSGLSYVIRQQLSLRLETLRLVVFPRTMLDSEMVHFIGSEVHAQLERVVESEGLPPTRDLRLSFSYMTISKFSQIRHTLLSREDTRCEPGWLAGLLKGSQEAIIFGLPSMNIRMLTDEEANDWCKTIMYDFTSRFARGEGAKNVEDIYITLNVSLYSWLTLLRKNFAKEMDQVQASAERANAMGPAGMSSRKQVKSPEPIYEEPESIIGSPVTSRPSTPPPTTATVSFPGPSPWKLNSKDDVMLHVSPSKSGTADSNVAPGWTPATKKSLGIVYHPRARHIERLTMRQLGEATPDVMHPFFMKKAGFSLEDSLPQYVHEYAAMPTEEIMKALLRLYSKQLRAKNAT